MSAHRTWIAFDCEAVAIADASEYLEPVTAPSNYKDAEKIQAYIADGTRRAIERAALDVDLARIVAIAFQTDEGQEPFVCLCADEDEERLALSAFWSHVRVVPDQRLVGFCIRTYDLPLLIRRSQLLGVSFPDVNMDRYRSAQMLDIYDRLTFHGAIDGKKLATYCKRFGVQADDDVTGSEISALVAAGDWDKVRQHALADVQRVVALARRLGWIACDCCDEGLRDERDEADDALQIEMDEAER